MTKEQKALFEILNTFWNLLKPYVNSEDEKAYKKIMTDNFRMLVKDRGEKFTDDWYKSTEELVNYPEKYKGTKFVEFAAELAIAITDYWTFEYRKITEHQTATFYDFSEYISKAFINEWGRLREKEDKTQTTG